MIEFFRLGLLLFACFLAVTPWIRPASGLSCVCGSSPCEEPVCCASGTLINDICGCCKTCAKDEGETCGGPFGSAGTCAPGLKCLRFCEGQQDDILCRPQAQVGTGFPRDCVFPFTYQDVIYNECTNVNSENGAYWCAVEVDPSGVAVNGQWGDCLSCSPASGRPTAPQVQCNYFNQQGRCVSQLPRRTFNDGEVEDGASTGTPIARCSSDAEQRKCFCSPPTDEEDNYCGRFNQPGIDGWCYLENVQNPSNPARECYPDAIYSPRSARFWSSTACRN